MRPPRTIDCFYYTWHVLGDAVDVLLQLRIVSRDGSGWGEDDALNVGHDRAILKLHSAQLCQLRRLEVRAHDADEQLGGSCELELLCLVLPPVKIAPVSVCVTLLFT